jgi:D-3-phosphoglycerate dehydrogenase
VARRLAGFGCRLLAVDPLVDPGAAAALGVDLVPLETLLPQAHFVSLHAPATPATVGLVNAAFLERMRPGAFLINTARGELVDEPALLAALTSGRLAGAALDCFRREPPGPDSPLLALPQVVVTPHLAAHTDQAMNLMGRTSLACCLAVLRGERPPHVVNPRVYETGMEHD